MSFQIFKDNMLSYMQNQAGIKTYGEFAKKLTSEYDSAIRRGYQTVNNVSVSKPNSEMMESMVNLALQSALQKREGLHDIINNIGKGIVGYWTGCILNNQPIPIIPAVGSIQNISVTSAMVTDPGKFPDVGKQIPTDDSNVFLDQLLFGIQIHLLSIKGIYNTISLYPGFPMLPPAPGILQWTGYTVPNARPTPKKSIEQKIEELQSDDKLKPDQIHAKEKELEESEIVSNNTSLPQIARATASEYSSLLRTEITSGLVNATPVDATREEIKDAEENTDDDHQCAVGKIVVANATRDLGIIEYGAPNGLNYGGFLGGARINSPGRIDEMFNVVGLDNQAKVRQTGSGYFWCAAAVSTWWKDAGLPIPNGGASCNNWLSWSKSNGYFSNTPKVGAAVLYGSPSNAHHIGIVSAVLPSGKILTIEGNTSGGGFDRNGIGVFTKSPKRYIGFVIPPGCSL